ncbi:hypothetical protein JCM10213_008821 [Rhodosporidiobolus nylandii]
MDSTPPTLVTLPPELLLRILALLDPQSIVRLSATCTALHAVGRAESLWFELVTALVAEHGVVDEAARLRGEVGGGAASAAETADQGKQRTWWDAASFLLPLSNYLGYFCSSKQFNSRVIRVSIQTPSLALPPPDAPPPRYTILGVHLRPRNLYDLPTNALAPWLLPFGALRDPLERSSYTISPNVNPGHPYAGISADVLDPLTDFSAQMFEITPEEGAVLCRAEDGRGGSVQTRENVLAAAMANGVLGGGVVPSPPAASATASSSNPLRLRIALEKVEQRVERTTGRAGQLFPGLAGAEDDSDTPVGDGETAADRAAASREALFALFSGRLPRTPWPTMRLVGLEEVEGEEVGGGRNGTVLRASGGAMRGLSEWLTERRGELPLARVEEAPVSPGGGSSRTRESAFVAGFRIRAKRSPRPTTSFSRSPETETTAARPEPSTSAAAATGRESPVTAGRRRGAGHGMGVMWQGGGHDPEEGQPQVTILRAGDEAEGGLVLHLPDSPSPPSPPALPHASPPASPSPGGSDSALADALDASLESFLPLKRPACPLSFASESALDGDGDVRASTLEGLWVGTYGAHGLEYVYLTVGFAEIEEGVEGTEAPRPSQGRRRTRLQRLVTATKVTGDPNVPSGQISWVALLPSPELAGLSSSSPSSPLHDPSVLLDGPLPSISRTKWAHLSSLDPSTPAYTALNSGAGPDWTEGTAPAYGRIALTGFTSASWAGAEVRFIRGGTVMRGTREGEEKTLETVEEIHLRWEELHKVGCLRRVRA